MSPQTNHPRINHESPQPWNSHQKSPLCRATPQPLRRQHRVGLRHQRRRLGRLAPAAAAADPGDAQTSTVGVSVWREKGLGKGGKTWKNVAENVWRCETLWFGNVFWMSGLCENALPDQKAASSLRVLCVRMCKLIVKRLHYARELTKD